MSHSIRVEKVCKDYQLGESGHTMLREALMSFARRCLGREPREERSIKHALKDVSFEIKPGEVVGLIGRNGAGKSTLLKILSKITYPTSGNVDVRGRVGSLLEVGTGFHDELTGRENIYMNGSILGMKKREIDASMEQIVEFADIGEFLDTPIKRYSSGMRMRLGFSVAAHLSTDVLFVDEVLAVGDVGFQKKCLGAMRELSDCGRTLVFVSHNMAAIDNLCPRTIWISDGQVKADGPTKEVSRDYLSSYGTREGLTLELGSLRDRQGNGHVRFQKMEILSADGEPNPVVHSGDGFRVRMHYECYRDIPNLHFGLRIFSNMGQLITDAHTWTTCQAVPLARTGPGCIEIEIDSLNLMPDTYYLGIWASAFHEWHDVLDSVAKIEIEPSDIYGTGRGVEARFGTIFLPFRWHSHSFSNPDPTESAMSAETLD